MLLQWVLHRTAREVNTGLSFGHDELLLCVLKPVTAWRESKSQLHHRAMSAAGRTYSCIVWSFICCNSVDRLMHAAS